MTMFRLAGSISLGLIFAACDPAGPEIPLLTPTTTVAVPVDISGVVRDDTGAPVSGALVGIPIWNQHSTTGTDGAYRLNFVPPLGVSYRRILNVTAAGYEPNTQEVDVQLRTVRDFQLRPLLYLQEGQTIDLFVTPQDALSFDDDGFGRRTRVVRFNAPRAGTAAVHAIPAAVIGYLQASGIATAACFCQVVRLPVAAGEEIAVAMSAATDSRSLGFTVTAVME